MKITKLALIILTICLAIATLVSCNGTPENQEPQYEELKLKISEFVTCKSNGLDIEAIIDYESSNITKNDAVSVNSTAENIAKIENNKLVVGDEYGEATLDIIVGNKKGSLSVKVVPYKDYLYALANKSDADGFTQMDYYAASWLINNLGAFKNPSSVSVEKVFYVDGTVTSTGFAANYLIMEIRAQNGFGGYGIDYYKVSAGSIELATISSYGGLFYSYNGMDLYKGTSYSVNKAVQEYIAENY